MSVITLFSGLYCNEEKLIERLEQSTGYTTYADRDLVARAAKISGIPENKLTRAFSTKTSVFNNFTHEKERSIASLKQAVAELLSEDRFIINGFSSLLVPNKISHALRVCVIGDISFRERIATASTKTTNQEALKLIRKHDEECAYWVRTLFKGDDPWEPSLYDILIPMNTTDIDAAVRLVLDNLGKDVLQINDISRQAVADFQLASQMEVALGKEGHSVEVSVDKGVVTLTINKNVLMLNRLEEELKSIATTVPGVKEVVTRVGKGFHQSDIYRKYEFEPPSKVLIVDDEREFVQTLSERLILRDVSSAVAYDGESALSLLDGDEPDVMILDLKMPGIDGIEVLKRVKSTRPEIEVIILTGHGSETDRETCMSLGAFAYLQKPVDIDLLSKTLQEANEKIKKGFKK